MASNTIQTVSGLGHRTIKNVERHIKSEFGVTAVIDNYYNPHSTTVSPLIFWWLGLNLVASIPVSIYSSITGQTTLPASNPMGFLMLLTMVGGLVVITMAHFGMYFHGKYVNSPYTIRSPVVKEN